MLISELYIVSMSMLVYMHMYDCQCRIMIGNTKKARTTQEERKKLLKDKNTEDGVNFRGKGCNDPPIYLYKFWDFKYYCMRLLGVELKCQGPTQRKT